MVLRCSRFREPALDNPNRNGEVDVPTGMSGTVQHAQAPIAPGSSRCVRLWNGASVERTEDGPEILSNEVSILVDAQPECDGLHPLIRWSDQDDQRALRLELKRERLGLWARLATWEMERYRAGEFELTTTAGKRLALRYSFAAGKVRLRELQPWGPGLDCGGTLEEAAHSAADWDGFVVGGASDNFGAPTYRGRVAEVALFNKDLPDLARLARASRPQDSADVPSHNPAALDPEGHAVLLEDYERLLEWHQKGRLTGRDLRELAALAHVWILRLSPSP